VHAAALHTVGVRERFRLLRDADRASLLEPDTAGLALACVLSDLTSAAACVRTDPGLYRGNAGRDS
jgi:hypothetical protein